MRRWKRWDILVLLIFLVILIIGGLWILRPIINANRRIKFENNSSVKISKSFIGMVRLDEFLEENEVWSNGLRAEGSEGEVKFSKIKFVYQDDKLSNYILVDAQGVSASYGNGYLEGDVYRVPLHVNVRLKSLSEADYERMINFLPIYAVLALQREKYFDRQVAEEVMTESLGVMEGVRENEHWILARERTIVDIGRGLFRKIWNFFTVDEIEAYWACGGSYTCSPIGCGGLHGECSCAYSGGGGNSSACVWGMANNCTGYCGNAAYPCKTSDNCSTYWVDEEGGGNGGNGGCTPSCSSPLCGQGDGCGGTCSDEDVGTYTEGAWSACDPVTFERTRTIDYACDETDQTETEDCRGEITGTFFDASEVDNCSNIVAQPKIEGVMIQAEAQTNHSGVYSDVTSADGSYLINGTSLRVPDDYLMSFSGLDTALYIGDAPKLMCDFGVADTPSTWVASLSDQAEVEQWRVGFWRIYGSWFQVQGGDVYADEGIESVIPANCGEAENWESCGNVIDAGGSYTSSTPLVRQVFNTDGSRDNPGVAFVGNGDIDLGGAGNAVVSSEGWEAVSDYQGRNADYGYFNVVTGRVDRQAWEGSGKPSGSSTGIYTSSGNVTIDSDWDLGGGGSDETMVVVHDGSVNITSNINVEKGSYLAVIASGSINVASNVTLLEGVYVADSTINIESTDDTSTDQQFIGEGTFIGWDGVSLNRDRGITNNSEPPHRFIFRQDFIVNGPDGMRSSRVTWREIRP